MRFWDSSALVPLVVTEPNTIRLHALLDDDSEMAVWWASPVELWSALARRRREGVIDSDGERDARDRIEELAATWTEVLPSNELRRLTGSLLLRHPLRAADSFQLAAAITAAGVPPRIPIITLDERLADAAVREGFATLP